MGSLHRPKAVCRDEVRTCPEPLVIRQAFINLDPRFMDGQAVALLFLPLRSITYSSVV